MYTPPRPRPIIEIRATRFDNIRHQLLLHLPFIFAKKFVLSTHRHSTRVLSSFFTFFFLFFSNSARYFSNNKSPRGGVNFLIFTIHFTRQLELMIFGPTIKILRIRHTIRCSVYNFPLSSILVANILNFYNANSTWLFSFLFRPS